MAERRYFFTDYLASHPAGDEVKHRPDRPFFTARGALSAGLIATAFFGGAFLIIESPEESSTVHVRKEKPTPEATSPARLVTLDQELAKQLLEDPAVFKLKNVTVWGDIKDKDYKENEPRVYFVNVRDKPYSDKTKTQQAGKIVGELPRGVMIPEAVVVLGNNPHFADRGDDAQGRWLAYLNPQDPTRVVFSPAEYFRGVGVDLAPGVKLAYR